MYLLGEECDIYFLIPHLNAQELPMKYPREKIWTHEIFTTKHFRPNPREKISDPRNTHEKKLWTHEIPTRKKIGPQNTLEKKFRTHQILT